MRVPIRGSLLVRCMSTVCDRCQFQGHAPFVPFATVHSMPDHLAWPVISPNHGLCSTAWDHNELCSCVAIDGITVITASSFEVEDAQPQEGINLEKMCISVSCKCTANVLVLDAALGVD